MIKAKNLEKLTVTKTDSKENLVSSSMMLVNNPGSGTIDSYFPDPRLTSGAPVSSVTSEDYYYSGYQQHIPWSYNYCYNYRTAHSHFAQECSCKKVPLHETFLHQILMGKGYKNDQLFMSRHIKQEVDYHNYGCCYGYPYSYGYPMY